MEDKTGGPAFPVQGFEYLNDADEANPERVAYIPYPGMTMRDYFAAKAMQQMIGGDYQFMVDIAHDAYALADAMIAARTK